MSSSPGQRVLREQSPPVGLVDQSLEGHLLLEGVIILQSRQGGQFSQTLRGGRGR